MKALALILSASLAVTVAVAQTNADGKTPPAATHKAPMPKEGGATPAVKPAAAAASDTAKPATPVRRPMPPGRRAPAAKPAEQPKDMPKN